MIRPYLPGDMWLIVNDIRQEQVNECLALGSTPADAIRYGMMRGEVKTVEIAGEVAGLVGTIQEDGYVMPWSVFNSVICKHPVAFLRECKRWVNSIDQPMINAVDARDEQAIRWLKWLGFHVEHPEPMALMCFDLPIIAQTRPPAGIIEPPF